MATAAIIVATSYAGALVLAFILGGPPVEIGMCIPGIIYLMCRWR